MDHQAVFPSDDDILTETPRKDLFIPPPRPPTPPGLSEVLALIRRELMPDHSSPFEHVYFDIYKHHLSPTLFQTHKEKGFDDYDAEYIDLFDANSRKICCILIDSEKMECAYDVGFKAVDIFGPLIPKLLYGYCFAVIRELISWFHVSYCCFQKDSHLSEFRKCAQQLSLGKLTSFLDSRRLDRVLPENSDVLCNYHTVDWDYGAFSRMRQGLHLIFEVDMPLGHDCDYSLPGSYFNLEQLQETAASSDASLEALHRGFRKGPIYKVRGPRGTQEDRHVSLNGFLFYASKVSVTSFRNKRDDYKYLGGYPWYANPKPFPKLPGLQFHGLLQLHILYKDCAYRDVEDRIPQDDQIELKNDTASVVFMQYGQTAEDMVLTLSPVDAFAKDFASTFENSLLGRGSCYALEIISMNRLRTNWAYRFKEYAAFLKRLRSVKKEIGYDPNDTKYYVYGSSAQEIIKTISMLAFEEPGDSGQCDGPLEITEVPSWLNRFKNDEPDKVRARVERVRKGFEKFYTKRMSLAGREMGIKATEDKGKGEEREETVETNQIGAEREQPMEEALAEPEWRIETMEDDAKEKEEQVKKKEREETVATGISVTKRGPIHSEVAISEMIYEEMEDYAKAKEEEVKDKRREETVAGSETGAKRVPIKVVESEVRIRATEDEKAKDEDADKKGTGETVGSGKSGADTCEKIKNSRGKRMLSAGIAASIVGTKEALVLKIRKRSIGGKQTVRKIRGKVEAHNSDTEEMGKKRKRRGLVLHEEEPVSTKKLKVSSVGMQTPEMKNRETCS